MPKNKALFALIGALTLGACQSPFNGADDALSVQQLHPIAVDQKVQSFEMRVTPSMFALTHDQRDEVSAVIMRYKQRGQGRLRLATPSGSPNSASAIQIAAEITEIARGLGVSPRDVDVTGYLASAKNGSAPLIVSYAAYEAIPSACGEFSSGLGWTPLNKRSPNFGCATQNNLAAMIEEPGDLVGARTLGPADQVRRATTLEKYRMGEVTSSETDDAASGAVSEVSE